MASLTELLLKEVEAEATLPICLILNPFLAFPVFYIKVIDDDVSWGLAKEIHQQCPACDYTLGNWINWYTKRLYFNLCVQLQVIWTQH